MQMHWSVRSVAAIVLGNVLYALTVKVFLLPANLTSGGATGIALAAHYLTGLPVSVLCFCEPEHADPGTDRAGKGLCGDYTAEYIPDSRGAGGV